MIQVSDTCVDVGLCVVFIDRALSLFIAFCINIQKICIYGRTEKSTCCFYEDVVLMRGASIVLVFQIQHPSLLLQDAITVRSF